MMRSISLALGTAAIANGIFMLVGPENWYFSVPGVTTTGPFNQHFVRHRHGDHYSIRLHITVPGINDILVSRDPGATGRY